MVVSDGVVHADAVLMVDAVAAVARLVFIGNALVTQRMVGLVLHLSVICPIGERVRHIQPQPAVVVDKTATRIACAVFILLPAAHQLS